MDNLRAARRAVDVPIVGIVKAEVPEGEPRITINLADVVGLVEAGADIIAYDATNRPRKDAAHLVLQAIIDAGKLAMADCSTYEDAQIAAHAGASIIGTTMSGYTSETETTSNLPDFDMLKKVQSLGKFVMAEGRFDTPDLAARAIKLGANGVTVGSSLTRTEVVTNRFVGAISQVQARAGLTGFAVDIGGTKVAAAKIVNGEVVARDQVPTDRNKGPMAQIASAAGMLASLGFEKGNKLGFAVTGRIDRSGNWYAINRDTLRNIESAPFSDLIVSEIGRSNVINDAAAATLAEYEFGDNTEHDNFAYVTVSTGVGGGLILNRRPHSSQNGVAGQLGFSVARDGNKVCGSGRTGTVESIAAGNAIAQAAAEAGYPGLEAKDVFRRANGGEEWAQEIVQNSAKAVADLCVDLVAIVGVTKIAIGGSIGLAEGYIELVRKYIGQQPELFQVQIVTATLGADGPLIGALMESNNVL